MTGLACTVASGVDLSSASGADVTTGSRDRIALRRDSRLPELLKLVLSAVCYIYGLVYISQLSQLDAFAEWVGCFLF